MRKWFFPIVILFFTGFLVLMMATLPCEAHKVKMFASAEGEVITGYVYYTTGGKPKNATILVQDAGGTTLKTVATNEDGEFSFRADARRDYVCILELPDGHRTSFTVTADELPDSLPAAGPELPTPAKDEDMIGPEEETLGSASENASISNPVRVQLPLDEIEEIVNTSVSKHIRPLREQLEKYEEKIRLHDILGGIGYILGLMGLGYFIGTRRKKP